MSTINGQLVICDLCGEQIFRKCIGEGGADGGYTRWNNFEDFPKGWGMAAEIGRLCPECLREYRTMIDDFKKRRSINEQ